MWSEKKFVVKIDEKYVDQKKHQIVTYIIGKAYDKNIYLSSSKKFFLKKLSDGHHKKKIVFLRR